jgi:sulfotransferase
MGTKLQKIKIPFLKKIFQCYFAELTDKPIVIDKRRSWGAINNIKMLKEIFGKEPKIICPVRNLEEIIASYKSLYARNNKKWKKEFLRGNRFANALSNLEYTWNSEFKDCLLLVEYNSLVQKPQKTLNKIYDFIGQPHYRHNLNNIVSNDPHKKVEELYGLKGMFDVHKTIQKSNTDIAILTKKEYNEYAHKTFWKKQEIRAL